MLGEDKLRRESTEKGLLGGPSYRMLSATAAAGARGVVAPFKQSAKRFRSECGLG